MTKSSTVTDAAYRTVHSYPGGAPALAARMKMKSWRVLDNKVNQRQTHHKLTVDEAVEIMAFSSDLQILDAMEDRFGRVAIELPSFEGVSDKALLETYTSMMKELGDFSREFHQAIEDGQITRDEIHRMRREAREFEAATEELLNRTEQLVDD